MANLLLGSTCPFNSLLCAVYCTCGVVLAKEDTQHSLIRLEQRQKSLTATSLGAVTRIFNSPPCSMRCFQPGWLYCDAKESKIALFSADVILHQIRGVTALVKNGTGTGCESPGPPAASECSAVTGALWNISGTASRSWASAVQIICSSFEKREKFGGI